MKITKPEIDMIQIFGLFYHIWRILENLGMANWHEMKSFLVNDDYKTQNYLKIEILSMFVNKSPLSLKSKHILTKYC